jgi:hypothetical protein
MTVRARPRRWREVQGRPVQGNSPNDRILRGPDCNRPKRVCADSFPATPWPRFPRTQKIPGMRFLRQAESFGPMGSQNQNQDLGVECRLPLVGPRTPVKERDGRSALCSSSAMSSDRLFLDRVARQHCPSPLHRHAQTTTHPLSALAKQDISTLQRIGHFYFALTRWPHSLATQSHFRNAGWASWPVAPTVPHLARIRRQAASSFGAATRLI